MSRLGVRLRQFGIYSLVGLASVGAYAATAASVLPLKVHRIITLTPALGELVALFPDAVPALVGVSEYTDFPESLKHIERVGGYQRLNYERIFSLKPDLLVAAEGGNAPIEVETLRRRHPDLLALTENSFADFLANVRTIGDRIGRSDQAGTLVDEAKAHLEKIRAAARGRPSLRVAIVVDESPLLLAGGPTYFTELLGWIGASNAFADLAVKYPRLAREEFARRNPEVVLLLGRPSDAAFRKQFADLDAVKRNRVYVLNDDALVRPGPRILVAAERLAARLYPASGSHAK